MTAGFTFRIKGWLALFILLSSQAALATNSFKVVTSIKPVHSVVAGLMKDVGEPLLLMDGHNTPYNFTLNATQKTQLMEADLLLWVGPELEKTLQPVVRQLPQSVRVVELLSSFDLKILPSRQHPDVRDPFFWMDDRNVMIMLDELTELLVEMDPARAHIYIRNRFDMLVPLRRIDKEYEYGYRGLKAGLGVLYFDTLSYFEQAYALKTLDRVASSPWDTEDASDLLKVRARIRDKEAVCLFIDKSLPADNLALLTEGQPVNVGVLDVLGQQFTAGPELYLQLMAYNTDVIKQCLNADMDQAASARLAALDADAAMIDGLGGRFILTDHRGKTVTEQDMKGQYSLLFFGYTSCPDVCPTSLTVVTQALALLGERAAKVQPYFISVDPDRDTVKLLNGYVRYFDDRLIGLTGSSLMIRRVAEQFKVKYEKGQSDADDPGLYVVDHTASLFLMAPDGSFVTKFAHGITADALASELTDIIR